MNNSKFIFFALSFALFFSCSGNFESIDPDKRADAPWPSSSGGGNSSSSSIEFSSSSFAQSSSSSIEQNSSSSSVAWAQCGARPEFFDPDLYECRTGDKIYLKTPVPYEGDSYEAVLIGTQTWMAKNLNYDVPDVSTDVCYSGTASNCITYGRLYNWATAMDIEATYNTNSFTAPAKHRGICPSGWHIPSDADWSTLVNYADSITSGTKLKATSEWTTNTMYSPIPGKDNFGFSALPGGYYFASGSKNGLFFTGRWWSSSEGSASNAWSRDMDCCNSYVIRGNDNKSALYSVRCLKD